MFIPIILIFLKACFVQNMHVPKKESGHCGLTQTSCIHEGLKSLANTLVSLLSIKKLMNEKKSKTNLDYNTER